MFEKIVLRKSWLNRIKDNMISNEALLYLKNYKSTNVYFYFLKVLFLSAALPALIFSLILFLMFFSELDLKTTLNFLIIQTLLILIISIFIIFKYFKIKNLPLNEISNNEES